MEDVHRAVLEKHEEELVESIILTEHLLGRMLQERIFDKEMVELIKAGKTDSERVRTFFNFLPKRGPAAFDRFYEVLEEQYDWLARRLQDSLVTEREKVFEDQLNREETRSAPSTEETSRCCCGELDTDIRLGVSKFVTKYFGQLRRVSNADKRAVESMMCKWMQGERKRLKMQYNMKLDNEITGMKQEQEEILGHRKVKAGIFSVYNLLLSKQRKVPWLPPNLRKENPQNKNQNNNNSDDSCDDDEEENVQEFSTDDITFDFLKAEVKNLLERMAYMQDQISKSYDYIDGNAGKKSSKHISELVHDLCGENRYRERKLEQEKENTENRLVELYNMSLKISELRQIINIQECEVAALNDKINDLRRENILLSREITDVEKKNTDRLEKEKTLEDLRKTKEDLQLMIKLVNEENKSLKEKLHEHGNKGQHLKTGQVRIQNRKPAPGNVANNQSRQGSKKVATKRRSQGVKCDKTHMAVVSELIQN